MNVIYAVIATLVVFAIDWTTYGRMSNIVSVARLSKGEEYPDEPYNPRKPWRWICAGVSGIVVFISGYVQSPVQEILYGVVALAVIVMLLCTYVECTARGQNSAPVVV